MLPCGSEQFYNIIDCSQRVARFKSNVHFSIQHKTVEPLDILLAYHAKDWSFCNIFVIILLYFLNFDLL